MMIDSPHGQNDFGPIEVKTSDVTRFGTWLHLAVRASYTHRIPNFYVQLFIVRQGEKPDIGDMIRFAGWATHGDLMQHDTLKDLGSKEGGKGGYMCQILPVSKLQPISTLREYVALLGWDWSTLRIIPFKN